MLASIAAFTNDGAGLEKTLRLFQSLCTVAIGLYGPTAVTADQPELLEPWMTARGHFMLSRRFFRLLKWQPCWTSAYEAAMRSQPDRQRESSMLRQTIEMLKWTFLGAYFFLEMFVITNAMGVTNYSWGPRMQLEANKCWFYALTTSIAFSLYDILALWLARFDGQSATPGSEESKREKKKDGLNANGSASSVEKDSDQPKRESKESAGNTEQPQAQASRLYTQLVIDGCDLFIPGSAIGWLPVGALVVGTCSTVSTLLAGQQIWARVHAKQ